MSVKSKVVDAIIEDSGLDESNFNDRIGFALEQVDSMSQSEFLDYLSDAIEARIVELRKRIGR